MKRGFTMVELLVVVGILLVLAAITVPLARGAIRQAERTQCLGNLRAIGVGLESYLADHNDRFPDVAMGRSSPEEDVETLEGALAEYLPDAETFHCPADGEQFAATGSSYLWNSTQSGRHKLQTSFFGTENQPEKVPLVLDKESFHGEINGVNLLYGDYHISNKIEFNVGSQ